MPTFTTGFYIILICFLYYTKFETEVFIYLYISYLLLHNELHECSVA